MVCLKVTGICPEYRQIELGIKGQLHPDHDSRILFVTLTIYIPIFEAPRGPLKHFCRIMNEVYAGALSSQKVAHYDMD